jgi:hypothetical protein
MQNGIHNPVVVCHCPATSRLSADGESRRQERTTSSVPESCCPPACVAILAILTRPSRKPVRHKELRRKSTWPSQDGHDHLGSGFGPLEVGTGAPGRVGHLAVFFRAGRPESRRPVAILVYDRVFLYLLTFPCPYLLCSTGVGETGVRFPAGPSLVISPSQGSLVISHSHGAGVDAKTSKVHQVRGAGC